MVNNPQASANPSPTGFDATKFFAPISSPGPDPLDVMLQTSPAIIQAVRNDQQVRETARTVLEWIARPIDLTAASPSEKGSESESQPATTLLSVMHLRVREAIRTSKLSSKDIASGLKDPSRLLKFTKDTIAKTDTHFIRNLLVETQSRASQDANFAHELSVAEGETKDADDTLSKIFPLDEIPQVAKADSSVSPFALIEIKFETWWGAAICVGLFLLGLLIGLLL